MSTNPIERLRTCFAILSLLGLLVAPSLAAQDSPPPEEPTSGGVPAGSDATITLEKGVRTQVRLAFPKTEVDASVGPDLAHVADEIEQTLRSDLDVGGVFNVQGPTELSVLVLTGLPEHDFEQYRSLGNEVVLFTTVKLEGDKVVLEGRVYDLPSRQSILGKRFRGEPAQARRIAHTLADALHFQFTGRPGLALTSIAFHSDRDGYSELYLMDYDGRNQRRISAHESTSGFADWSPTGDAIAYVSYYTQNPGIHYVDLATGRKIPVWADGTLNLSPSFSPDGKRIVFAHSVGSNVDLFVCERVCKEPRRLTDAPSIDTNPVWSPNGEQIAFTSDRSGRPNVYVMNADGSEVRRISFEGSYNDGATWRPDGTHVAYASRQAGYKFQIAVTELVDLRTHLITDGPDSYEEPSYSPDGRLITFTVRRGRESQVFVMDADGGNWRQLTHEGNNMSPDWSSYPPR